MKNILTKRAMTLFELLAVIVILGIILAIGFPTVTRLINNSRKDSFVANVNSYVAAAKADALSEWAAKGESVIVIYTVDKDKQNDPDYETFGIDVFDKGKITIEVNEEGKITKITLKEPFVGKGFKTRKNLDLNKGPITRDNIISADSEEEEED